MELMRLRSRSGQALIELAIFGSMMIVVMGALINFGMNADLEQQTAMRAARDAMFSGARARLNRVPDSENYIHLQEGFVPDPTNPFALGQAISASGMASSPTRSSRIGVVPRHEDELPRTIYMINGQPINCPSVERINGLPQHAAPGMRVQGCTTSGFRDVFNVWGFMEEEGPDGHPVYVNNPETVRPIDKYDLIFGIGNMDALNVVCNAAGNCRRNLRIIDPNEGEIVSRDQAVYYCRQILDRPACESQCLLSKKDPTDIDVVNKCRNICHQTIATPEYCDAGNGPSYLNTTFAQLFPNALDSDMGFQGGSTTSVSLKDTTLFKQEAAGGTRTIAAIHRWIDGVTGRSFVLRDKDDSMAGIGTRMSIPVAPSGRDYDSTDKPPVVWATPHD